MTKCYCRVFFIFRILNTYETMMFYAKIQPNIPSGSGEVVDFIIFAILVMTASLEILPDPILQFSM